MSQWQRSKGFDLTREGSAQVPHKRARRVDRLACTANPIVNFKTVVDETRQQAEAPSSAGHLQAAV